MTKGKNYFVRKLNFFGLFELIVFVIFKIYANFDKIYIRLSNNTALILIIILLSVYLIYTLIYLSIYLSIYIIIGIKRNFSEEQDSWKIKTNHKSIDM